MQNPLLHFLRPHSPHTPCLVFFLSLNDSSLFLSPKLLLSTSSVSLSSFRTVSSWFMYHWNISSSNQLFIPTIPIIPISEFSSFHSSYHNLYLYRILVLCPCLLFLLPPGCEQVMRSRTMPSFSLYYLTAWHQVWLRRGNQYILLNK